MFYKVLKNNKVIDVLDGLVYLKYQSKYKRMVFCKKEEAQAIFSSDRRKIWHLASLYDIPVSGYDTVQLEEIDQYEYERLKVLNCQTADEIVDATVLDIIQDDFNLCNFAESLRRLYWKRSIDDNQLIKLSNDNKITEKEKLYILSKED